MHAQNIQSRVEKKWCNSPHSGPEPPHSRGCKIKIRHTTLTRNSPDEWSARRGDFYRKTHNAHKTYIFMCLGGIRTRNPIKPKTHVSILRPVFKTPHWILCSDNDVSTGTAKIMTYKGKAIPLEVWTGSEGSRRFKLPDFKTIGIWRW
jgi:hypothetical protein